MLCSLKLLQITQETAGHTLSHTSRAQVTCITSEEAVHSNTRIPLFMGHAQPERTAPEKAAGGRRRTAVHKLVREGVFGNARLPRLTKLLLLFLGLLLGLLLDLDLLALG